MWTDLQRSSQRGASTALPRHCLQGHPDNKLSNAFRAAQVQDAWDPYTLRGVSADAVLLHAPVQPVYAAVSIYLIFLAFFLSRMVSQLPTGPAAGCSGREPVFILKYRLPVYYIMHWLDRAGIKHCAVAETCHWAPDGWLKPAACLQLEVPQHASVKVRSAPAVVQKVPGRGQGTMPVVSEAFAELQVMLRVPRISPAFIVLVVAKLQAFLAACHVDQLLEFATRKVMEFKLASMAMRLRRHVASGLWRIEAQHDSRGA